MTDLISRELFDLPGGEACFRITMAAPRANALEPGILAALHTAFDALERSGAQKVLICGGRNFSTGGDVGRFFDAAQEGRADDYARAVVPVLQDLIARMIATPAIIATALRGAATGGSAGLLFGSDLAVAAPGTFVQPYYGTVGFAPDGGWTAILPELIGTAQARGWLMANHRYEAEKLLRLGLVQAVDEAPEIRALALLGAVETGSALATKAILWDAPRRAVLRAGLDAETSAFLNLIGRRATLSRMKQFLQPSG